MKIIDDRPSCSQPPLTVKDCCLGDVVTLKNSSLDDFYLVASTFGEKCAVNLKKGTYMTANSTVAEVVFAEVRITKLALA